MFPGLNNGARRNLLLHRVEFIKPLRKQPLQGASPAPPVPLWQLLDRCAALLGRRGSTSR